MSTAAGLGVVQQQKGAAIRVTKSWVRAAVVWFAFTLTAVACGGDDNSSHGGSLVMPTCDRVIGVDFGVVIASGTPKEVREKPRREGCVSRRRRCPRPGGQR